ncbi:MAG: TIM44-like domain-containing protein [Deltaproteobacteria bacterium]|jgi:predicted lipid-binding transport protein (Tim44 family)|nr:TIM44-like domain-containing protein [Deltaproteobacteria bacterium]
MKKFLLVLFLPLLLTASFVAVNEVCLSEAQAARFGGGRSFGGKSSFQRRAPAQTQNRQQATQSQNAAAQSGAAGGFARGGMGGLFGSLLAGSMLGALIFGGAFSGLGAMDIVVILLGVFMITRLLRGRRAAQQSAGMERQAGRRGQEDLFGREAQNWQAPRGRQEDQGGRALRGNDAQDAFWGHLRSDQNARASQEARRENSQGRQNEWGGQSNHNEQDSPAMHAQGNSLLLPADFDLDDFMAGAKAMYTRLQEAWDSRDLEDIEQFATKSVAAEIRSQAQEDPEPSQTDILLINAELIGFETESADKAEATERAAVYFDVLLREEAGRPNIEAREIWHFMRRKGETWKLDGIQQTE